MMVPVSLLHLVSSVHFLQFVYIFTTLAPRVLLDLFKAQIRRSSAFNNSQFDAWDGSERQRRWLGNEVQQSPFFRDYICRAVCNKDVQLWDVTTLSAVLGAIMEPAEEPAKLLVKQARGKNNKKPMPVFEVLAERKAQFSSWEGFRVNVKDPSTSDIAPCRVTVREMEREQVIEIVSMEKAKDKDLHKKVVTDWETEINVFEPVQEVEVVILLRSMRNFLFHVSKPEIEETKFKEFMDQLRPFLAYNCDVYWQETGSELFVNCVFLPCKYSHMYVCVRACGCVVFVFIAEPKGEASNLGAESSRVCIYI